MNRRSWRVLTYRAETVHYTRIECQILDLELALALMERAAFAGDADLLRKMTLIVHDTYRSVSRVLRDLTPDLDQHARIAALFGRLGKHLQIAPSITNVPPSRALH